MSLSSLRNNFDAKYTKMFFSKFDSIYNFYYITTKFVNDCKQSVIHYCFIRFGNK